VGGSSRSGSPASPAAPRRPHHEEQDYGSEHKSTDHGADQTDDEIPDQISLSTSAPRQLKVDTDASRFDDMWTHLTKGGRRR
jgi:hypothetical protein